ncbi:MAG: hypothetical protein LBU53_04190 [Zoogloeaceae bacterium]|jgi:hypothetical protein|nr:hypothetical protein [Zoogloeaceae bacterium]
MTTISETYINALLADATYAISLVLALVLLPLDAWACSCGEDEAISPYKGATIVVLAKVTDITKLETEGSVRLDVLRSWKSESPETITVFSDPQNPCGFYFYLGKTHILYLYKDKEGKLQTDYCSGNLYEHQSEYQDRIRWLDNFNH